MSSAPRARGWIDGASRGNPGDAGFGVVFELDDGVSEIGGFLGRTTNNVAEYSALLAALTYARDKGIRDLELFSDSQLLVRQFGGAYRVKASHLVPLFLKVMALRREIPNLRLHHVPREKNAAADRLANRAIDERLALPSWLDLDALGN